MVSRGTGGRDYQYDYYYTYRPTRLRRKQLTSAERQHELATLMNGKARPNAPVARS